MYEKYREQNIARLNLNDHILETLKNNELNKIKNVCSKSKSELKKLGFTQDEVSNIEVEVELLGLRLKNGL